MNYKELRKLQMESTDFLDNQPIEYQPFVTDCIISTDNIIKAKEKFIKELKKYLENL